MLFFCFLCCLLLRLYFLPIFSFWKKLVYFTSQFWLCQTRGWELLNWPRLVHWRTPRLKELTLPGGWCWRPANLMSDHCVNLREARLCSGLAYPTTGAPNRRCRTGRCWGGDPSADSLVTLTSCTPDLLVLSPPGRSLSWPWPWAPLPSILLGCFFPASFPRLPSSFIFSK